MDKMSAKLLTIVVVLQGLILLGQWTSGRNYESVAQAQVLDAGAQRADILNEMKATNTKLEKMIGILESGNLQVRLATPDESKKAHDGR